VDTQTPTQTPTPGQELATMAPDCRSERLWTALSARWLGRCREKDTMETEAS
jgi:hypothetical protein